MTTFLNRFSNSDAQRVRVSVDFVGTFTFHDALAYDNSDSLAPDKLVVTYAGTPAFFTAGIGFKADGTMLVFDASGGLPADTRWQSGLPISEAQSRLCVDPTNAVTYVHQGVPFTSVGAVAVDGSGSLTTTTISQIVILQAANDAAPNYFGQLQYGDSSAVSDTYYSVKATYLAANPGGNLQTFSGIAAPGATAPMPAFGAFSISAPSGVLVADDTFPGVTMPWDAFVSLASETITINFTPPVEAAGLNYAYAGGKVHAVTVQFYDGATLLHEEATIIPASPLSTPTWSFSGWANAAAAVVTQIRITGDSENRITGDGDTRVWV